MPETATAPQQRRRARPLPPMAHADGLTILLHGLFDYAGMFPPASLELDGALSESARSPTLRRSGMVGADLVVDRTDLPRLDEERFHVAGFGDTEAKVVVVGVESDRIAEAAAKVAQVNEAHAGVFRITSLEAHGTVFPGAALRDATQAAPGVSFAIEPRLPDAGWSRNAPGVLGLLERLATNGIDVGLKVRCSGPTAIQPATLAWLLPNVVAAGIPFKATAGLHHPIVEPHHGNAIGFLGLATALRLRQELGDAFTVDLIQRCLTETDARAFGFDGEVSWRGHAIGVPKLLDALVALPFSIGSCSLREPDEDLERLFG